MEIGSVHDIEGAAMASGHQQVMSNGNQPNETVCPPLNFRRPAAGPQSVCSSIRRKSTIYDHSAGGPGVKIGPSTPERPLLYAFNDTGVASPSPSGPLSSQHHIYMEVADPPLSQAVQDQPPPPPLPTQKQQQQHFQPIQIPILVERRAESSNSSQSSGYYSEYRPPSSSRELKMQQQQQHKPKLDLPVSSVAPQGSQGTPGRQLDIQDSQFI